MVSFLAACDLAGCDLAGCDLAACDLAGCDLAGCDLAGCDLAGVLLLDDFAAGFFPLPLADLPLDFLSAAAALSAALGEVAVLVAAAALVEDVFFAVLAGAGFASFFASAAPASFMIALIGLASGSAA
ncbi:MAG: pentapeptide repeat-containing protein [Planctomycetales bacterium]|nr:pentapeptide repeat-containing protein [Planctomycetales bacterium]